MWGCLRHECFFFCSSRRRHTRCSRDWSSDVCSSDLEREGENHALIAQLQKSAKFEGSTEVNTIDGLRVEYPDGFGLMRASNTTPVLVLRFEGDSQEALVRIQNDFKRVLLGAKP